jgi:hypothetical protein
MQPPWAKSWRRAAIAGGASPRIVLSGNAVAEDAAQGTAIGTFSVSNSDAEWTFSLTDTAGDVVQLDGVDDSQLEAGVTGFDYETATSHLIAVQATASGETTLNGTFTISVTDVADVVPSQFGAGDWSVADAETSGDINITITTLPDPGDSPITDLEYQIDAGAWVSLGDTTTGVYGVAGLTDDVQVTVAVRAVNAAGDGTASAGKTVTPTDGGGAAAGDSLALFDEGGVTLLHVGMI